MYERYSTEPPPAPAEPTEIRRRRRGPTPQAFSADLVYALIAPGLGGLWAGGGERTDRPVAAVWSVAPGARRPFVANLADGRPAVPSGSRRAPRLEFPRSAKYLHLFQETSAGPALHTILAEGLFEVEPLPGAGADEEGSAASTPTIRYVTLVPRREVATSASSAPAEVEAAAAWVQGLDLDLALDQLRVDPVSSEAPAPPRVPPWAVGLALWWLAQLDRRVVAPVIHDPGFALQAFLAALVSSGATGEHRGSPGRFSRRDHAAATIVAPRADGTGYGRGLRAIGDPQLFAPAVVTVATEAALQRLLAREILIWTQVRALRASTTLGGDELAAAIDELVVAARAAADADAESSSAEESGDDDEGDEGAEGAVDGGDALGVGGP